MGIFDKKYCDICGEKIGLLGNHKLEDGNLCKNCANKLSPWFNERRNSTVAEIKEQLNYREANREKAEQFCTTRTFGERTKLLLDEQHNWFTITRESSPAKDNADVLDFSAITGCRFDIDESHTELKMEMKDGDGKIVRKSYNPPRYEYDYDFYIILSVNTPYFSEMKFKLNDSSVHIPFQPTTMRKIGGSFFSDRQYEPLYDPCYRGFKESCEEICNLLNQARNGEVSEKKASTTMQNNLSIESFIPGLSFSLAAKKAVEEAFEITTWRCASCGSMNNNTFICKQCGTPFSDERVLANLKNLAFAASMGESVSENKFTIPMDEVHVENSPATQEWICPSCGSTNSGNFCESCGKKRP